MKMLFALYYNSSVCECSWNTAYLTLDISQLINILIFFIYQFWFQTRLSQVYFNYHLISISTTLAHGWVASLVISKKRFCLFVIVNKLYSKLNFTPKGWRYIQEIYLTSTLTKECCSVGCFYHTKRISSVIVRVFALNAIEREFELRSCQDSLNLYATLRKSNDFGGSKSG
jgi:hypothetical protein